MNEIWKDIAGFEGLYQVSNKGNVRSLDRYINSPNGRRLTKGKLLSHNKTNGNGYKICRLCKDGKQYCKYFHRLVAECFLDENGDVINHKNGNKGDNRASNLEWVSQKDNCQHSLSIGLTPIGEEAYFAKITDEQSFEIYKLAHDGLLSQDKIAKIYGISQTTVSEIKLLKIRKRTILKKLEE